MVADSSVVIRPHRNECNARLHKEDDNFSIDDIVDAKGQPNPEHLELIQCSTNILDHDGFAQEAANLVEQAKPGSGSVLVKLSGAALLPGADNMTSLKTFRDAVMSAHALM